MLVEPIVVLKNDLPPYVLDLASSVGHVCIDLETSGLDFRVAEIGSIQVLVDRTVYVMRPPFSDSHNIRRILADNQVKKIFHHAMFDLRFIKHFIGGEQSNIACTKIASKIAYPERNSHTLFELVREHFGIILTKELRGTNWLSEKLSPEQLNYAAGDVVYLKPLLELLVEQARNAGRASIVQKSFDYIPTRVVLDVQSVGDVFLY